MQPNARLIGIEYIISRPLFEALPEDEKKCADCLIFTLILLFAMCHTSHQFAVTSGSYLPACCSFVLA